VLSKGSKTKTTTSIGITLGFLELGLGLGLQLSTILSRSLFGNSQRMLIIENKKCTLVGIPIIMRLGGVRSCPAT
jgi:hypothetical protein